jgi:HAD superfamily hydrolase (TIGR01509 family)
MRAVVFDCDGLLLETESRWTLAEIAVCEQWGVPFSMELKRRLLGTALDRAGELLAEWVGEPPERSAPLLAERLITAYRDAVDEHGVDPMPGAAELVVALADRVPVAVASNTREADTRRVLARSGLPDVFTAIVCAGDGIAPKPAPDVYLAACAALGAEPSVAIALEDSPTGVAAARAAGMHVIGVPSTPGVPLDAHRIVASLTDVTIDILSDGSA